MLTESSSVPRHNEGNQTPAVWAVGTLFLFGMVFDMCISCVYIYTIYNTLSEVLFTCPVLGALLAEVDFATGHDI